MALTKARGYRCAAAQAVVAAAIMIACLQPAAADVRLGIEAFYISGTHYESSGNVSEQFVAPILHLSGGGNRVQVRAEGVPSFGINSTPTSADLPATTNLGFVDGTMNYALDKTQRYWLGVGGIIVNQQTQLPPSNDPYSYQTESSHVAGARYEAVVRIPIHTTNAVILDYAGMPNLYGTVFGTNCKYCYYPEVSRGESGAMTDWSAVFETKHARSTWDFGVRFINYSAVFSQTQMLADRNVGGGIIVRYTYTLAR